MEMKPALPRAALAILAASMLGVLQTLFCQTRPIPTWDQIITNVENGFAGIEDYTVDLDVVADLERMNVPPMHATMYFKQPDKIHFEADGFALLPREGMALNPRRFRSRYSAESVTEEYVEGARAYKVTLKPKDEKKKFLNLWLYVDPEHWTVARIVVPLLDGRLMSASPRYQQIGDRWLPASLTVTFSAASIDTTDPNVFDQLTPPRRPLSPRNGTVIIKYSQYRLNTGLSDDLFDGRGKAGRAE
jgi:outer membrane lipoprotein-sorting protein